MNFIEFKQDFYEKILPNKPEYIRDMTELFINKIHPNAERIRNLQYNYNSIEERDEEYHLIQKPYTFEQIEINYGDVPKIIKKIR